MLKFIDGFKGSVLKHLHTTVDTLNKKKKKIKKLNKINEDEKV